MPFLYLPDAVSLTLLLIALSLLRRSAVAHVRQELLGLRNDMFLYWCGKRLPLSHPAYLSVRQQIDDSTRLVPKVAPARLFFIRRICIQSIKNGCGQLLPDPADGLECCLKTVEEKGAREKLRRIQLEVNTSLGTFLLVGSISGWILGIVILFRMITRLASQRPKERIDRFFDLAEKVLSHLGCQIQRIARSAELPAKLGTVTFFH